MTPEQIAAAMPQIEAHVAMGLLAFPAKQVKGTKVPAKGWQSTVWDLGMLEAELRTVPYYGLTQPRAHPRRLVILDLDDGRSGLQPGQIHWRERWNALGPPPKTKTTNTPSGGAHAWYVWPEGAPLPGGSWHGFTVRKLVGAKNWAAGPGSVRPDGKVYQNAYPGQAIAAMPLELALSGGPAKPTNGHADESPERLTTRDEILILAGRLRFAGAAVNDIETALLSRLADGRIYPSDPTRPWTEDDLKAIATDIGGKPRGSSWMTPVTETDTSDGLDLADYLAAVEAYLTRYIAFPSEHEPVAIALWVAHAYLVEQFDTSPILAITSAEMRSGKTRVLDCLEMLVPHPERSITPSEAVLYTVLAERPRPTLLLDEVDAIFSPRLSERNEGIRAILNSGNRKGTPVPRVKLEGRRREVERFDVYGPKAIAGIGNLPTTVADRAIPIRMKRRAPNEPIARFRERQARAEAAVIRFAPLSVPLVPDVPVPEALNDRAADSWEPLLVIADSTGQGWPERARAASLSLSCEVVEGSSGIRLLADIRDAYDERGVDHLSTVELLDYLHQMEEAPWSDWYGKPLSARALARLLDPYRVRPVQKRLAGEKLRGYLRSEFSDAWMRYVPASESGTSGTSEADTLQQELDLTGGEPLPEVSA